MIREAIQNLVDRRDLPYRAAEMAMQEIMNGSATSSQIGAFLTALRMKGESVEEIFAFASTLRGFCHRIRPRYDGRLLDTCGTGGDKIKTFNVSTVAAFVIAGAGVKVAKHGNRSVTSQCGSADVLERLGLNLNAPPELVEGSIEKVGIGFLFAPFFNPAAKNAIGPRREIGIRTVFNILGPLTNPAEANVQLVGVYLPSLTEVIAAVLEKLGCYEAMVVHGLEGLDEIAISGATNIAWLKDGSVKSFQVKPEDLGLKACNVNDLRGSIPEENAKDMLRILNGQSKNEPKNHVVLANAAAGILVGGLVDSLAEGIDLATESIESGRAYTKLVEMIKLMGGNLHELEELEAKSI